MLVVVEEFVKLFEASFTHKWVELSYNSKNVLFVVGTPNVCRLVMRFLTWHMVWSSQSTTPDNIIEVLKNI